MSTIGRQRVQHLGRVGLHLGCNRVGGGSSGVVPALRNPLLAHIRPRVAVEDVEQEIHARILNALTQLLHVVQVLTSGQITILTGVHQQATTHSSPPCHIAQIGDDSVLILGVDDVVVSVQPFVTSSFIGRNQRKVSSHHSHDIRPHSCPQIRTHCQQQKGNKQDSSFHSIFVS